MLFIAKRLRDLRLNANLTQERVAELSEFNYKFYQKLESGNNKYIRLDTIVRIANFWGMTLSEFFSAENDCSYKKECSKQKSGLWEGREKCPSQMGHKAYFLIVPSESSLRKLL